MMNSNATGNETLDRIQQEIKESLEREEELRKKYNNNNNINGLLANDDINENMPYNSNNKNGYIAASAAAPVATTNGDASRNHSSSFRRFIPNPSAKGVMQKFLRMRGKLSLPIINPTTTTTINSSTSSHHHNQPPSPQTIWVNDDNIFEPAKVTVEPGKPIRNGFVPAEEKMRKELQEFQLREEELRKERRKSQPDLMAALEAEAAEIETNLKPARSMALLYSTEDLTDDNYSSGASSLKPARSLAELCDASDDELETPGTHSLIMQFENLKKNPQART